MIKSKPKYLFIGLGVMGYPMAGHLSKLNSIDLYIYNRSTNVTKKWLAKHNGHEYIEDEFDEVKFDGLILSLKDDASIINVLSKNKFIELIKPNGGYI